jgi:hypothetical protein
MGKKAIAKQKKRERAAVEAAASGNATPEVAIQPVAGRSLPERPGDTAQSLVDPTQIATQLNSVAIHLLRRLHREDAALGLSGARLSALSVLVFGGPRTIGKLAEAETAWRQVLAIDPKSVEAHYDLGFMYLSKNPPDLANVRKEWNEVIAIAPDSDIAKTVATHLKSLDGSPAPSTAPSATPSLAPSTAPSATPASSAPGG